MYVITTSYTGTNSDLFPLILDQYVSDGAKIADVTYGRGVFWSKVDKRKYDLHFSDLHPSDSAIPMEDACHTSYEDVSLDALDFDPPYMHDSATVHTGLDKNYRNRSCKATATGGGTQQC